MQCKIVLSCITFINLKSKKIFLLSNCYTFTQKSEGPRNNNNKFPHQFIHCSNLTIINNNTFILSTPTKQKMTELDKPKSSSSPSGHLPPPQSQPLPPPQYGTFQGVSNFPAVGFPQPVPPPGSDPSAPPYYPHAHGYQAYPGLLFLP